MSHHNKDHSVSESHKLLSNSETTNRRTFLHSYYTVEFNGVLHSMFNRLQQLLGTGALLVDCVRGMTSLREKSVVVGVRIVSSMVILVITGGVLGVNLKCCGLTRTDRTSLFHSPN